MDKFNKLNFPKAKKNFKSNITIYYLYIILNGIYSNVFFIYFTKKIALSIITIIITNVEFTITTMGHLLLLLLL